MWKIDFWSSRAPFSGPKIKVPYHFSKTFCYGTSCLEKKMSFHRINLIFWFQIILKVYQSGFLERKKKMEPFHIFRLWKFQSYMAKFRWNSEIFKIWKYAGAPVWAPFLYFLKIQLGTLSILSGIKNQIDSIKTHIFIQTWSAQTNIFKKLIRHFDFGAWKWSSRTPKINFSQYLNSWEFKKFQNSYQGITLEIPPL